MSAANRMKIVESRPSFSCAIAAEVFPKGLVQIVQGGGRVGAALLDQGVDAIVFTGSVPSGKKVAVRAAELLIPCSVELGGKDAAIVLADPPGDNHGAEVSAIAKAVENVIDDAIGTAAAVSLVMFAMVLLLSGAVTWAFNR